MIHYLTCSFRPVSSTRQNMISRGLPIFERFCKPLSNVVTETFAKPSENWEISSNRILPGTISTPSYCFICIKLMIHYLTCGFRPVSSTRQNVISQDLPVFRRFCKPLGNAVTETFAEPTKNRKISSNRVLTGRISLPSRPFINSKLVINYLRYGFRPVSSTC